MKHSTTEAKREYTRASAARHHAQIDALPHLPDWKLERALAELREANIKLSKLRALAVDATSAREIQRINAKCVPLEREIRGMKLTLGIIAPEVKA